MNEDNDITESTWKGNDDDFKVFLSYIDSFHRETNDLADSLKFYGVDCFVAKYAPTPAHWPKQIKEALSTMDAFVPLITNSYHSNSYWTNQEIGFAFAKEVPIIPIKLESVNPQGLIWSNTAISANWDSAPSLIVEELLKCQNSPKMVDALIKALEQNCISFSHAASIKRLLDKIPQISNQQAQNLILAFYQNDQVGDCHEFCGNDDDNYGEPLVHLLEKLTRERYNIEKEGIVRRENRAKRIKKLTQH